MNKDKFFKKRADKKKIRFDKNGIIHNNSGVKRFYIMKGNKGLAWFWIIWALLATVIMILLPPALIDYLYAHGVFKNILHGFSASDWFTMLFSYVPSTLSSILSLYLAYIVFTKDRELERIQNRNRFILPKEAVFFKYDELEERELIEEELREQIVEIIRELPEEIAVSNLNVDRKYFFRFYIRDMKNIQINHIQLTSFQWMIQNKIAVRIEETENLEKKVFLRESRFQSGLYVGELLYVEENSDIQEEINACLDSGLSLNQDYRDSYIFLALTLVDEEQEIYDLELWFRMRAPNMGVGILKSINESYYVKQGR